MAKETGAMVINGAIIENPSEERVKREASMRKRRLVTNIIVYVILTVMAIIWLAPIVWLLLMSFSGDGYISNTRFFPQTWTFDNYANLWNNVYENALGTKLASAYIFFFRVTPSGQVYLGGFIYTFIIAIFTAIISTLFCLATAYAFSRLRFKARKGMMRVILILGMFPGFLGLIVLYQIFRQIGMIGSGSSHVTQVMTLIIVYSGGSGMGYYISKGFFDTVSKQIDEAAMIDGATRFQIFYKIILPLSKPIVVYQILTSFMGPWAEYITASYLIQTGAKNYSTGGVDTVAVILKDMLADLNLRGFYFGQFCAGAVIVAVPTAILFLIMQKNYVSGVTGGAVKG